MSVFTLIRNDNLIIKNSFVRIHPILWYESKYIEYKSPASVGSGEIIGLVELVFLNHLIR